MCFIAQPRAQNLRPSFFEVENAFKNLLPLSSNTEAIEPKEGEEEHFERWKYFMQARMKPNGTRYEPDALWQTYQRIGFEATPSPQRKQAWRAIGPMNTPKQGGGVGRANVLRFVKKKPSIAYLGTACGGLWKSNDNAKSWQPLTDKLPSLSISDIALNPNDGQELYIATGDPFGFELQVGQHLDFWGGTYSAGVFHSTDGGSTWEACGLTYQQTASEIIQRLLLSPRNHNILLAATRKGLYRSSDKGQTWTKTCDAHFFDMEWHENQIDKVYAISSQYLYASEDAGATWQIVTAAVPHQGRLSLATTPANPDYLYVMDGLGALFLCEDSTMKFEPLAPPNITTFLYFSSVLEVSPVNANHILAGGIEIAQSFDAGKTWKTISNPEAITAKNFVHADQHGFTFQPTSNDLYAVNDGGVFCTQNQGETWTDRNKGLQISQIYRISNHEKAAQTIYAGLQDNGVLKYEQGEWTEILSLVDGMECISNEKEAQEVYVNAQFGRLFYSADAGEHFVEAKTDPQGTWVAPMQLHPKQSNTLIDASLSQLFQSKEIERQDWESCSPVFEMSELIALKISPSHPHIRYALSYEKLYQSLDNGQTWEDITSNLPIDQAAMTSLAISDYNPNKIWLTFSGYEEHLKVFHSNDGGKTWINISRNLPNIPINCIQYQPQSLDVLYIGTDMGVYYATTKQKRWLPYNEDLPNTIINDLEINLTTYTLRAATFGRGLWEVPLPEAALLQKDMALLSHYPDYEANLCYRTFTPEIYLRNNGLHSSHQLAISQWLDNRFVRTDTFASEFVPASVQNLTLSSLAVDTGAHILTIYLQSLENKGDENAWNDTLSIPFAVAAYQIDENYSEDFEENMPSTWQISPTNLVKIGQKGSFDASSHSFLVELYNQTQQEAVKISLPAISLKGINAPISLHYDWAHQKRYPDNFLDTLKIEASRDCGATWQLVAENSKEVESLSSNFQYFTPQKTDWQKKTIALDDYANTDMLYLRFAFVGENTNNYWIDKVELEIYPKEKEETLEMWLYPTLIEESYIYLEMKELFDNYPKLTIFDLTGRELATVPIDMQQQRKQKIILPQLPSGNYLFQVISSKSRKTWKVFWE
ncbi:MAG: hypothetical protein ACKVTZ_05710 [Bacteroidia bacterium]